MSFFKFPKLEEIYYNKTYDNEFNASNCEDQKEEYRKSKYFIKPKFTIPVTAEEAIKQIFTISKDVYIMEYYNSYYCKKVLNICNNEIVTINDIERDYNNLIPLITQYLDTVIEIPEDQRCDNTNTKIKTYMELLETITTILDYFIHRKKYLNDKKEFVTKIMNIFSTEIKPLMKQLSTSYNPGTMIPNFMENYFRTLCHHR